MFALQSDRRQTNSPKYRNANRRRRALIEVLEERMCLSTVPGLYGIGMVTSTSEVYQLRFISESDTLVPYQLGTLTELGSTAPPARDDAVLANANGGAFLCVADNQAPGSQGLPSMLRQTDISVFESGVDLPVTNLGEVWMINPFLDEPATLDVRINALEWSPSDGNQPAVLFAAGVFGVGLDTSPAIFTIAPETQQATPIFDLTGVGTSAGDIAFDFSGNLYLSLVGGDLFKLDLATLGSPTPDGTIFDLPSATPNFEALLPYEPGETLVGITESGDYHVITLATSQTELAGSLRDVGDGLDVGEVVYGATISYENPIDLGTIVTLPIKPIDRIPRLDQLWYEFDVGQTGDLKIDLNDGFVPGRTWMMLYDGSSEPSVVSTGSTQINHSVNAGDTFFLHVVDLQPHVVPDLTFSVSTDDSNEFDFGDAPTSYGTLLVDDGARHSGADLSLGPDMDLETDGQPSADASGDGEDENGVRFLSTLLTSEHDENVSSILVNASSNAKLDGWIDFNGNGTFDHPEEHLFEGDSIGVNAGDNLVSIGIPDTTTTAVGNTYARFRLSSSGALLPTGAAVDGEVEDYSVEILGAVDPQPATIQMFGMDVTMRFDGSQTLLESGSDVIFAAPTSVIELVSMTGTTSDDTVIIDAGLGFVMPVGGLYFTGEGGVDSLKVNGDFNVDITDIGNAHLVGVSVIDLTASGKTVFTLDEESVSQANAQALEVRMGGDDEIEFTSPTQWLLKQPVIRDGRFMRVAQAGSSVVLADGPHDWQNPIQAFDVSSEGTVSARDALLIINELGRGSYHDTHSRHLREATTVAVWPGYYYDVSGDGNITAVDALRVINQMARMAVSSAEGEPVNDSVLPPMAWANNVDSSLIELLSEEEEEDSSLLF